jgi:hydrogenase maturation protease
VTLVIAIGNPERADDGVAAEVCRMAGPGGWTVIETMELTPEMAERVSAARRVIFVDADYRGGAPSMEALGSAACLPGVLTHSLRPCDLVLTARRLFGFSGEAWLLRVPGVEFGLGNPLSETAKANAAMAAKLLEELLEEMMRRDPGSGNQC